MLTFLTRRLTVGMVGGALLVASLASECSAPIGNFVDTREVEAGMVCRFPWGISKVLTVESGGVTASQLEISVHRVHTPAKLCEFFSGITKTLQ